MLYTEMNELLNFVKAPKECDNCPYATNTPLNDIILCSYAGPNCLFDIKKVTVKGVRHVLSKDK